MVTPTEEPVVDATAESVDTQTTDQAEESTTTEPSTNETDSETDGVATSDEENGSREEGADVTNLSHRAQKRFQQLSTRVRELESRRGQSQLDDGPTLPEFRYKPGQEIRIEDLQRDLVKGAQGIVQLELAKERNIDRIANETIQAETKYPELNPDSKQFNKEVSTRISKVVERELQRNPRASVIEIVEDLMALRDEGRRQGTQAGVSNTLKGMSKTAVTPTGSSAGNKKAFKDLSLAEMEKRLGYAN